MIVAVVNACVYCPVTQSLDLHVANPERFRLR